MTSPLLALFGRSLREDTRLKMTYITRVGLVLIILLFLLSVRSTFGWGNAPGLHFFGTVMFIDCCFILLAGVSHFASAVTEEKEEGTLGLLRMTNLNALSILLGKSTSRVVNALLLLAVQIPFTLLAISLGGVAVRQILAAYCTLGAFIIFLANLALLGSVVFRRTMGAAVFTGVTLFVFFLGVPFLGWMFGLPTRLGVMASPSPAIEMFQKVAKTMSEASPFNRLSEILSTGFSSGPVGFQVWSNLAVGALCFLLAWGLFDFFCDERQEASSSRNLLVLPTSKLRRLGAGRAWPWALAWKDFYFYAGGKGWLAARFIIYAIPPLLIWQAQTRWSSTIDLRQLGGMTLWLSFLMGCAEVSFIAGGVLRQERRLKTLSSLALLPTSLPRIAYQKILGCLPALFPALFYMALGSFLARRDFQYTFTGTWRWSEMAGLFYAGMQGVLFLHVVAILSLYLRRGGLPAAIAIHFVWNMLVSILAMTMRGDDGIFSTLFVLGCVCTATTVFLHWRIGRRLEDLAAED